MFDFSGEFIDLVSSFDISSVVDIVIVGGALSRRPASSSKINGDQIIIAAFPAK